MTVKIPQDGTCNTDTPWYLDDEDDEDQDEDTEVIEDDEDEVDDEDLCDE